jgi:cleavage and polyadenylation specificity factor subunit 1
VGKTSGLVTLWQETELNDSKGTTKQATLGLYLEIPDQTYLDGGIISFKKIHVGMTVHQVIEVQPRTDERTEQELLNPNHNPNRRTYLLLCSEEVKTPFLPNILTDEEKEKEAELYERFFPNLESFSQPEKTVGAPPPLKSRRYKIAFIQNGKCVGIHELPEGENVLGMEVAYLTLEKVQPKIGQIIIPNKITRRVFIVVSTSISDKHGEDTQGYGNLLFFGLDIARFDKQEESENVVAESKEEQKPVTVTTQSDFYASIQPKLVLIHKGPGPASIVKQCGENIISTVGSVVYVYKLIHETMKLEQIAFYFAKFYIVSISVIKNYILLSDFGHSVQLLVWREADRSLNPISRDYENCVCLSTSFVPVSTSLGMVCGDDEGNIQILQCCPQKKAESLDGQKLLCTADFHLGSDVGVQVIHPLLTLPPGVPSGLLVEADSTVVRITNKISTRQITPNTVPFDSRLHKGSNSNCVLLGTMDGSLGILVPIDERVYRRLNLLQQLMSMVVQTPCALNPQEFRLMKTRRYKFQRQKGLLDGTLLWKFPTLEAELQEEIVKALGVTIDTIMESLQEVDLLASFF